jgi:DNA-binding MarR family transcriptional regulator
VKLPNELLERAFAAYAAAVRVVDPLRFQIWWDRGLTMPQVRVLFELSERDNLTAGELADILAVAPPTITGLTDRLVRSALIERREDARDRRVVRLALSADGRKVTGEIAEAARAYLTEVFEQLPPGRLEEICAALEDLAAANAGVRDGKEAVRS